MKPHLEMMCRAETMKMCGAVILDLKLAHEPTSFQTMASSGSFEAWRRKQDEASRTIGLAAVRPPPARETARMKTAKVTAVMRDHV